VGHHVQCSIFWAGKTRGRPWVQPSYVIKNLICALFFCALSKNGCAGPKGANRCRVVLAARFRVNEGKKTPIIEKYSPPKNMSTGYPVTITNETAGVTKTKSNPIELARLGTDGPFWIIEALGVFGMGMGPRQKRSGVDLRLHCMCGRAEPMRVPRTYRSRR
jgi:hypothetical protein